MVDEADEATASFGQQASGVSKRKHQQEMQMSPGPGKRRKPGLFCLSPENSCLK